LAGGRSPGVLSCGSASIKASGGEHLAAKTGLIVASSLSVNGSQDQAETIKSPGPAFQLMGGG